MGSLLYGSSNVEVTFDDRALMHLQIVITSKLRRGESFIFTWSNEIELGSGRSTIWLDPSSTLYYHYSGSRTPTINREWIEVLMLSANSASGLIFTPEPNGTVGRQPHAAGIPTVTAR